MRFNFSYRDGPFELRSIDSNVLQTLARKNDSVSYHSAAEIIRHYSASGLMTSYRVIDWKWTSNGFKAMLTSTMLSSTNNDLETAQLWKMMQLGQSVLDKVWESNDPNDSAPGTNPA